MPVELGWAVGVASVGAGLLLLLRRETPGRWVELVVVGCALTPFVTLFAWNPDFRIYSRHGLLHAAMLYRIGEEGIPPTNPLVAGEPLGFHWAYECLGAVVSRGFGISPSWSFALINLAALAVVLIVLARVVRPLVDTPARGLFAPMVAIFAITPIPLWWLRSTEPIQRMVGPLMSRATPVAQKFANTNGVPLGLMCLALVIAAMRIPLDRPMVRFGGIAASLAGCGVLYPPLLPAAMITVAAFSIVEQLQRDPGDHLASVRRLAGDAAAAIAGCGAAAAVMVALDIYPTAAIELLAKPYPAADIAGLFLTVGPGILVIAAAWSTLRKFGDRLSIWQLLVASAANSGCFLLLSLNDRNEYKFLIAGQLLMGLVVGAALLALRHRYGIVPVAVTTVLFLGSFAHIHAQCLVNHRNAALHLREDGRRLVHPDPEQDRLYRWIGEQTPPDAAFVDSELLVTVLGPRALVAPYRSNRAVRVERERGFINRTDLFVQEFQRIDPEVAARRRRLVQTLLDGGNNDVERSVKLLHAIGIPEVWVICRTSDQRRRLGEIGADEVYVGADGLPCVMRWTATTGSDRPPAGAEAHPPTGDRSGSRDPRPGESPP
jgi:hypothetical protein